MYRRTSLNGAARAWRRGRLIWRIDKVYSVTTIARVALHTAHLSGDGDFAAILKWVLTPGFGRVYGPFSGVVSICEVAGSALESEIGRCLDLTLLDSERQPRRFEVITGAGGRRR